MKALRQMGIRIEEKTDRQLVIHGGGGRLRPSEEPIYLGNSGTSIRLLTAVAALGKEPFTLLGNDRMAERPIDALTRALEQIGVQARSVNDNGCPPVEIDGKNLSGKTVAINCRTSSQYLSGLLLMAPCTADGLEIAVTEGPVSKPYVDMTIDVMSKFGVDVDRHGYETFFVGGKQSYMAGNYEVEADDNSSLANWNGQIEYRMSGLLLYGKYFF
jgi:3-phosphoshikimate 1-carboxyvinyltransferase